VVDEAGAFEVTGAVVDGFWVTLTVGAPVLAGIQNCSSQFSPLNPWLHTQLPLTHPPFPLHTTVLAGEALLLPLKLALHELLEVNLLAGEALLSPLKFALLPQTGRDELEVVLGAEVVVVLGAEVVVALGAEVVAGALDVDCASW